MGLRETLNSKPWIGWAVAGAMILVAGWFAYRSMMMGSGDRFAVESMRETVTIKYTDTGDTEEIHRGRLIKRLLAEQKGRVDPAKGLINPKTGQPSGFLFDQREWDEMMKELEIQNPQGAPPGAPKAPKPPTPPQ
jgi:hypothetical protein